MEKEPPASCLNDHEAGVAPCDHGDPMPDTAWGNRQDRPVREGRSGVSVGLGRELINAEMVEN